MAADNVKDIVPESDSTNKENKEVRRQAKPSRFIPMSSLQSNDDTVDDWETMEEKNLVSESVTPKAASTAS